MPHTHALHDAEIRRVRIATRFPAQPRSLEELVRATGLHRTLGGVDVYLARRARMPSFEAIDLHAALLDGTLSVAQSRGLRARAGTMVRRRASCAYPPQSGSRAGRLSIGESRYATLRRILAQGRFVGLWEFDPAKRKAEIGLLDEVEKKTRARIDER